MNYILTETTFTGVVNNKTITMDSSSVLWEELRAAIIIERWSEVADLCDCVSTVVTYGAGNLTVQGGVVYYKGRPTHNTVAERILRMISEGFNVKPMLNFLDNLMANPSYRSTQELYRFLEHNNLPITEDGYFLAYKRVRDDFTDTYSGTFDNSVGKVCEMPRNSVEDNPDETCSTGLHFCSIDYLSHFWGNNIIILKINPVDVVSIPTDYGNSKGRCCRYKVIGVHLDGAEEDTLSDSSVYTEEEITQAYSDGYEDGIYAPF